MKPIFRLSLLSLAIGVLHAEEVPAAPEKAPANGAAKSDKDKPSPSRGKRSRRLNLAADNSGEVGYKAQKAVSKSAGKGSQIIAVTRSGKSNPIQLAALAPENDGVTLLGQPTLWWWQSESTAPMELEFTLSKVGRRTREVLTVKLDACEKGYQALDLSDERINPEQVSLEAGGKYMWSIGCDVPPSKAGELPTRNSMMVYMVRDSDENLEELLAGPEITGGTLGKLSNSGNWYELFDLVTYSSKIDPEDRDLAALREKLLGQVNLGGKTKP